jgi:hypothetical protein
VERRIVLPFSCVNTINIGDFNTEIYIRNQGHIIPEAVNRPLAHDAYHTRQIVFIGRMIKREARLSLPIPKGNSKAYNDEKFAQDKYRSLNTDGYLKKATARKV